jgi:hypothetical protein
VEAFPDLRLTVEDIFSGGNMVAARVAFRGTHRGEFQGIPPTGKEVAFSSIEIDRMVDGKVAVTTAGNVRSTAVTLTPGTRKVSVRGVHLSGRIDLLDDAGGASVRRAVRVYKELRHRIPGALPVWPLGLPGWYDPWCAAGLADPEGLLVQVWRRGGEESVVLPLPSLAGRDVDVEVLFPAAARGTLSWSPEHGTLHVHLPDAPSARLLRLTPGV